MCVMHVDRHWMTRRLLIQEKCPVETVDTSHPLAKKLSGASLFVS